MTFHWRIRVELDEIAAILADLPRNVRAPVVGHFHAELRRHEYRMPPMAEWLRACGCSEEEDEDAIDVAGDEADEALGEEGDGSLDGPVGEGEA